MPNATSAIPPQRISCGSRSVAGRRRRHMHHARCARARGERQRARLDGDLVSRLLKFELDVRRIARVSRQDEIEPVRPGTSCRDTQARIASTGRRARPGSLADAPDDELAQVTGGPLRAGAVCRRKCAVHLPLAPSPSRAPPAPGAAQRCSESARALRLGHIWPLTGGSVRRLRVRAHQGVAFVARMRIARVLDVDDPADELCRPPRRSAHGSSASCDGARSACSRDRTARSEHSTR